MKFTIGITTFQYRFETYFKPLLEQIKTYAPEVEVLVAVNGEHNQKFDNEYRKNILEFTSKFENTYVSMYPNFRSLSKLWNNLVINSTNDYILLLNDDISFTHEVGLHVIDNLIDMIGTSFKINGSWSHCLLRKSEVMSVGYFNEIFLGIGEEDGEFEHRYVKHYNKDFGNFFIPSIINHVDMSHSPSNIKQITNDDNEGGKYSLFNKEVMYKYLYRIDEEHGIVRGVCPFKLVEVNPILPQYPYEKYYLENRHRL